LIPTDERSGLQTRIAATGSASFDPAITPRVLDKAALAYRQAGKTEEADRLSHELRERYLNYAGGS
jgi:hypothetical protein